MIQNSTSYKATWRLKIKLLRKSNRAWLAGRNEEAMYYAALGVINAYSCHRRRLISKWMLKKRGMGFKSALKITEETIRQHRGRLKCSP